MPLPLTVTSGSLCLSWGPISPICKTGRCGFARDHSCFPQDLLGSAVMRMWLPGEDAPPSPSTILPAPLPPTPESPQKLRAVRRLRVPGRAHWLPRGRSDEPPVQMHPRRLGWEGPACVRGPCGDRELLQDRALHLAASAHTQSTSRRLAAALWQGEGPEHGGEAREGRVCTSAPQLHPLLLGYLMGQQGGGGDRKP